MAKSLRNVPQKTLDHAGQAAYMGRRRRTVERCILFPVFGFALSVLGVSQAYASDTEGKHTFKVNPVEKTCTYHESTGFRDRLIVNLEFKFETPLPATAQVDEVQVKWTDTLQTVPEPVSGKPEQYLLRRPLLKRDVDKQVWGRVSLVIKDQSTNEDNRIECKKNGVDLIPLFESLWTPILDYDVEAFQWWMEQLEKDKKGQRTRGEIQEQFKEEKGREPTEQEIEKEVGTGEFFKLKQRLQPDRPVPGLHEIKHYLVHLPSGAVAPPYPSDITESTRTQVVIVLPVEWKAVVVTLSVSQCDVPETFRTTFEQAPDPEDGDGANLLAQEERKLAERRREKFVLHTVGPILRCGPSTLEYDLDVHLKVPIKISRDDKKIFERQTSQRLRVNPKYHIAAVFAVGWDSAEETQYYKGVRLASETAQDPCPSTATPPETDRANCIASREVRQGAILYIGAQWMIAGVDYHNFRWWNWFANLFVAVNAAAPLDDFAFGLTFTPTGGISLAVGPTFHKRTWLGDGFTEGQVFNDDGDIPTSRRWQDPDVGAFIGLTIDTNIFRALSAVKYD